MTWAQIRREIIRGIGYSIADIINHFNKPAATRFASRMPSARQATHE